MITIKATIFLDGPLWVGLFERIDKEGFQCARYIFGAEPQDQEVLDFINNNYAQLKFGTQKEFKLIIKRKNPKRVQKEVRREMEKVKEKPSSFAQDYIREELEKNKKLKKTKSKQEKELNDQKQFELKQKKKKEKHKGH